MFPTVKAVPLESGHLLTILFSRSVPGRGVLQADGHRARIAKKDRAPTSALFS